MRYLEKEYMDKHSSYYIEKLLIDSISIDEVKDFIKPILKEYSILNKKIEEKISNILIKNSNLNEISKYFVELLIKQEIWWNRYNELKDVLNAFNRHLYSKFPHNLNNIGSFKEIDIHLVPIEEVIQKYIKINWSLSRNIKCPLHNDKTASFKIYKNTDSFYCFWCNQGWNAINFISAIENINSKEAFKRFIELFNL